MTWQRSAARRAAMTVVLLIIGIVLLAVISGPARFVGLAVTTLALIVAVALIHYEVGLSEDRERAGR